MIIKFFEFDKIDKKKNKLILLYGKNEGLKKECIEKFINNKSSISNYEEKEVLDNKEIFLENLTSKSLFDDEKIIVIKRATDKIFKIIEHIVEKNIEDALIIINAENLEKKSKLRSFFEKSRDTICIAFYPDNNKTLSDLTYHYLKERNVSMSPANINLLVSKCNGSREILNNELRKVEYYCKNGKQLNSENLSKLINLIENHSISELVDSCLIKDQRKTINILNENNFSNEDCILITRTFLNKSKRILALSNIYEENKNIDLTISSAKPPIFWKDKEIVKQQIYKWSPVSIKKLIYKVSELELLVKKNINISIKLIVDFVLDQSSSKTNS